MTPGPPPQARPWFLTKTKSFTVRIPNQTKTMFWEKRKLDLGKLTIQYITRTIRLGIRIAPRVNRDTKHGTIQEHSS